MKASIQEYSKVKHPYLPVKITELPTVISQITKAFICAHCPCIGLNQTDLKYHWAAIHESVSLKVTKIDVHADAQYQCFWCQEASDIYSLEEHFKKLNPDERFLFVAVTKSQYKCAQCSFNI